MKRLLINSFIAIISLTNVAYADFLFQGNDPNVCATLAGSWDGEGTLSHWVIGQCVYKGVGNISKVDNTGNFTLALSADRTSGSLLCTAHISPQLSGTCVNGNVRVKSEYGELSGSFTHNTGQATGTLALPLGINADTVIKFNRHVG